MNPQHAGSLRATQTSHADPAYVRALLWALGGLLSVGAAFAVLVAVDLLIPGTVLDLIWRMAPEKQAQFTGLGVSGPLLLLAIGAALIAAATGLFLRRGWGRWLSVALLVVNLAPDIPDLFRGDWSVLLFAVPIAGLVGLLSSPVVGRAFRDDRRDALLRGGDN